MTTNAFGIDDNFGDGGAGLAPGGGAGPRTGLNLRDQLRAFLASIWPAVADVPGLQATLAANRKNGQQVVTLDTYTIWTWKEADATAADGTHIAPTDVAAGAGRWVAIATTPQVLPTLASLGVKSGTGVLVAGVSAALPANITANSRIVVTRKLRNGSTAVGTLDALGGDRTNGTPGSFVVTATKADGTTETNDVSSFDWLCIG